MFHQINFHVSVAYITNAFKQTLAIAKPTFKFHVELTKRGLTSSVRYVAWV